MPDPEASSSNPTPLALQRVNRALLAISQCNQAIARAEDERLLMTAVCRVLVQVGGYCLAWVGLAEQDKDQTLLPVAWAGIDVDLEKLGRLTWAEGEKGLGPTARAIRTRQTVFTPDVQNNPGSAPWKGFTQRLQVRTAICLPLFHHGGPLGALSLYSTERMDEDPQEMDLLEQMAATLVIGLLSLRDRQERLRSEHNLRQANRALQATRQCHQALARADDELSLLQQVCQVMVETGGYRMAWVGEALQDEQRTVRPLAWAGHEAGFLSLAPISWKEGSSRIGPTGRALLTRQPCLIQDFYADPYFTPWREAAVQRGFSAAFSLPLVYKGQLFGALGLYAGEGQGFDDQEVSLLAQLADDLAYGLNSLRERQERQRAEAALVESLERFRLTFHTSPDSININRLADGLYVDVNDGFTQLTGYTHDEVVGRTSLEINIWNDPAQRQELVRQLKEKGFCENLEADYRVKDGSLVTALMSARVIMLEGVPHIISITRDISERKQAEQALQRRAAELEAVYRISVTLRSAGRLDQMLPLLLDETLAVLGVPDGAIHLYDPQRRELRPVACQGWFAGIQEAPLQPGQGIAGHVFSSGEAHLSTEFAQDGRILDASRSQVPAGYGGACLPIRSGEEMVGVLFVALRLPRQIAPMEVKLLSTLAEIAGSAIQRMRLHEQMERHLKNLSALRVVDQAISSNQDLGLVFNMLLEKAVDELGVDAACLLVYEPETQTLRRSAECGFNRPTMRPTVLHLGTSLAGRVVGDQRMLVIPDLRSVVLPDQSVQLLLDEGMQVFIGVPLIAHGRPLGVMEVLHRSHLDPDQDWYDFLQTLANQAGIAMDHAELFNRLQHSNLELALAYEHTLEGWSRTLNLRDQETEEHTQRVVEMTVRLAMRMGLEREALPHLRRGALLHDIGKMGVPDSILQKPDKLTEAEWKVMRRHPEYARDLLQPIPFLRQAMDIPYCHHEKWDGSGYPRELSGEQIPLAARIFAVVDVWDALCSDRYYRPAWPQDEALKYIRQQSGRHFDPQVVEAFLALLKEDG